jgi:hypothetical protein
MTTSSQTNDTGSASGCQQRVSIRSVPPTQSPQSMYNTNTGGYGYGSLQVPAYAPPTIPPSIGC